MFSTVTSVKGVASPSCPLQAATCSSTVMISWRPQSWVSAGEQDGFPSMHAVLDELPRHGVLVRHASTGLAQAEVQHIQRQAGWPSKSAWHHQVECLHHTTWSVRSIRSS